MFYFLYFVTSLVLSASSLEVCENGVDICPTGNTCCAMPTSSSAPYDSSNNISYGCISSNMGPLHATCCLDDGITGCAVNYMCSENHTCTSLDNNTSTSNSTADPLLHQLPRYQLCRGTNLDQVHGFSVGQQNIPAPAITRIAYYSSHGDITGNKIGRDSIQQVLLVIHGANRNADDYFCAASAAAASSYTESVLIIAPRFLTSSDGPVFLQEGGVAARWLDTGSGPWRYGAESIYPSRISSFHVIDNIMKELLNITNFPNLNRIVVVGHSSGGQFVQRWALLTSIWDHERVRAVVANPSSYAYLIPQRFINGHWELPPKDSCPQYNQWEWGMEPSTDGKNDVEVAYKIEAMDHLHNNISALACRYNDRDVVYLVGSLDRCNVSTAGWCNSHGLETTCMDELQGSNRWERSLHHLESLKQLGIFKHKRIVVEGVGHDHSLIFTSPEGLQALSLPIDSTEVKSDSVPVENE